MNKLVVVTGGTQGIGKAIVEKFAEEGFDIIICARNQITLNSLQAELNSQFPSIKIDTLPVDLSRRDDVQKFIEFVKDFNRPVDVLVNNAGVYLPGTSFEEPEGQLETLINTNLYGPYHLTRGLIKDMIDRKSGYIFNICSIASIMAYKNSGSYTISKFAMLGFTKSLRDEMKPFNIRVTAVIPGAVLTSSWDGMDIPAERFIKPQDVANSLFSAYTLSDSSVIEELLIRPQLGDL
ncbi:MAG: SDR family NAD(P)-dependent oxidoreductase [Bacteroidetes bacterium]|nr:SDR family NAD(P)-dependent oxidoreductase [Bacteroidota bacterium]